MTSGNKKGNGKNRRSRQNPPASPYVRAVLALYTALPHTPARPRPDDRFVIRRLESQRKPLLRVQAALLLGTARRVFRADTTDPLMPIRSFRFFLPVIDELRFAHVDQAYINYLARKIVDFIGEELPLSPYDVSDEPPRARRRLPRQLNLPW